MPIWFFFVAVGLASLTFLAVGVPLAWDFVQDRRRQGITITSLEVHGRPEPCPAKGCSYDPRAFTGSTGSPLGMHHCPGCGRIVVGGLPHPSHNLCELCGEGSGNRVNGG